MSRGPLSLIFATALLVALVAALPLRLALDMSGLSEAGLAATDVRGSIWRGEIRDVVLHGARMGRLHVELDPLAMASNRGVVRLRTDGPIGGQAVLGLPPGGLQLSDADLTAPLEWIFRRMPFRGRLTLTGVTIHMAEGRCSKARGRMVVSDVRLAPVGPVIAGLSLSGEPVCRDGGLLIPLSGAVEGARADVVLRVDGEGRYRIDTRIRTTDPTVEAAFGLAGFPRGLDGFSRTDQGVLGEDAG